MNLTCGLRPRPTGVLHGSQAIARLVHECAAVDVLEGKQHAARRRRADQALGDFGRHDLPMLVEGHVALAATQQRGHLGLRQAQPLSDVTDARHDPNSSANALHDQHPRCFARSNSAANVEGMGTRNAKITAETMAEAQKLRAIWEKTEGRLNQTLFGETFQIGGQSAVGQFLRGDLPLSAKAAAGFAKGLGCSIWDFSPRLAKEISEWSQALGQPPDSGHKLLATAAESPGDYKAAKQTKPWPLPTVTVDDLHALDQMERIQADTYIRALVDRRKTRSA